MPLAKTLSISLFGLTGRIIEVETDISSNLPAFVLVGLPDASIQEAASRVRSATTNSKLPLPARRITVNLSPASVPKQGSSFDLSIAISAMSAAGYFDSRLVETTAFMGELSLDGRIKPVTGVLAAAVAAKQQGVSRLVVPLANLEEAKQISGIEIAGYDHLTQIASELGAKVQAVAQRTLIKPAVAGDANSLCFSEVLGQEEAITALTIAAVGGHHVLMVGPPGAGKTMLASRLPSILPDLSESEAIEVGAIKSLAKHEHLTVNTRPSFQAPHHTASMVAMVGGGGTIPKPGLISMAHRGVLFLDEAPEFHSSVLDSLRQPIESGDVTISRAAGQATFPARFQLVLAANPCPCGYSVGTGRNCTCNPAAKNRYLSKISGPLSDRIDIRMELDSINTLAFPIDTKVKTSIELRAVVESSRISSGKRLAKTPWSLNSQVPGSYLRRDLRLPRETTKHLDRALERRTISMRGYDRCLRLAWSIADLNGREVPSIEDIGLATFYREGDR